MLNKLKGKKQVNVLMFVIGKYILLQTTNN